MHLKVVFDHDSAIASGKLSESYRLGSGLREGGWLHTLYLLTLAHLYFLISICSSGTGDSAAYTSVAM